MFNLLTQPVNDVCGYLSKAKTHTHYALNHSIVKSTIAVLIFLVLLFPGLKAADIFINCNSTSHNPNGSIANPFRTISVAIDYINNHIPTDNKVTFQIMTGVYPENIELQIQAATTIIDRWEFKAYNGEVAVKGNGATAPLAQILNMMGADVTFENIIFQPTSATQGIGFLVTSPCTIDTLMFTGCSFIDLHCGLYITEDPALTTMITTIGKLEVSCCRYNGIKNEGWGILTSAANNTYGGDSYKFIWNVNIHNNTFLTDGIENPVTNYEFNSICIRNFRKDAAAYDSVFVNNNIFTNNNSIIHPVAISLIGLNKFPEYCSCDRKLKARVFENEIKNYNVKAAVSKLNFYQNRAYLSDNFGDDFLDFASRLGYSDTLWTNNNYVKTTSDYYLTNSILIDMQNSHIGTPQFEPSSFLTGENSSAYLTNSLITGFTRIFPTVACTIQSKYCFYDHTVNNTQISYGDGMVYGDPLIVRDDENMTYELKWNSNEKSPCIMAGYSLLASTRYDRPDIGAIQYSENPHEYIRYSFPPTSTRSGIKWMCFPTADRLYNNQDMAFTMFNSIMVPDILQNIAWKPYDMNVQTIQYNPFSQHWDGPDHTVIPQQGYKFQMNNPTGYHYIWIPGIQADEQLTLQIKGYTPAKSGIDWDSYPENWLGYFVHKSMSPWEAFQGVLDNLFYIGTQNWTCVRQGMNSNSPWIVANTGKPITLSYGDAVVVKCFVDDTFQWNTTPPEREPYEKEDPQHFLYQEKMEYVPVYIDFTGTILPKEVGLFINDICKGAAVVKGDLVEVPAYIKEAMPEGTEIEIRLFYDNKANDIVPVYATWNHASEQFVKQTLVTAKNQDYYRISINNDNNEGSPVPKLFLGNYPNPFNPSTVIRYYLPKDSKATLDIFNTKGQKIKSLLSGYQTMGYHDMVWDGKDNIGKVVASGIYFATFEYQGKKISQKMVLTK